MAVWPLWTGVHVVIYSALSAGEQRGQEGEGEKPGKGACLVGCVFALGLVLALMLLGFIWAVVFQGPQAFGGSGSL